MSFHIQQTNKMQHLEDALTNFMECNAHLSQEDKQKIKIYASQADLEAHDDYLIRKITEQIMKMQQPQADKTPDLLTPTEVVEQYHIARTTQWRWERDGLLVPSRIGRKVFYKRADIEKALK